VTLKNSALLAKGRGHCGCCAVDRLAEGRCRVQLPPSAETHAISGDRYQKNHGHRDRLADGIVFWAPAGDDFAACVELKGGRVEATVVSGQLQNAASLIEEIALGTPDVKFAAVLASNQLDGMALKLLRNATIAFRGRRHRIVRVRCGADLSAIMRQPGRAS